MVTDRTQPISTTKRIAFSLSPNQRIAKGTQQMLGRDCRLTSRGPTVSSKNSLLATPNPRIIPRMTDNPYPMSMRFMVTAMPIRKL